MDFIKPLPNIITIYTKTNCPRCDDLKILIKKNNINVFFVNCDDYLNDDDTIDKFETFLKELGYDNTMFPFIYDEKPIKYKFFYDKLNAFTNISI